MLSWTLAAASRRRRPTPGSTTEWLSRVQRGLVIIGGATGSGKTTTAAALVDEINRRDAKHIITIEDPIEYEHANHKSVIQQVEIGIDAPDFPTALRSALRQANALHHLHQEITITRKQGSFSLEECLARLVKAGLVDRAEAALRANHPEDFAQALAQLQA